jgi:hypothetical protein
MARSRSKRPISSHGGRRELRGCGRWFVALFLIVWGLGFGGGGVAAMGSDDGLFGFVFVAIGSLAILAGLGIALGWRTPWSRRGPLLDPALAAGRGEPPAASLFPVSGPAAAAPGPVTLRAGTRRGCVVLALWPFTLFWWGLIAFLFAEAGEPDGPPMFMALIFGLFGLALIAAAVHQTLALSNPRTEVDLERAELPVDGESTLTWRLVGSTARLSTLKFELIGREEASYTRGTDRVTDRHDFHTETLLETSVLGLAAGGRIALRLPPRAVPSFAARSNKIRWLLRVRGPIRLWPDVDDTIELPVGPGEVEGDHPG